MDCKINFENRNGVKYAYLDWGSDSTCEEFATSRSGNIFALFGWSNKNDNRKYFVVFDERQIFFKKSFSSEFWAEKDDFFVFDDKTSILVTDEHVLYFNELGESISRKSVCCEELGISQDYFWCVGENANGEDVVIVINLKERGVFMKKTPTTDMYGIKKGVFWCYGCNDEGENELFIFNLAINKTVKKIIDDFDEDTYASDAYVYFDGACFVVLYQNQNYIAYDSLGKKVEPSLQSMCLAKSAQNQLIKKRHDQAIEDLKSDYGYWKAHTDNSRSQEKIEQCREELVSLGVDVSALDKQVEKLNVEGNTVNNDVARYGLIWKAIQWFMALVSIVCVLGNGFHYSSLFLLISAVLFAPIEGIRNCVEIENKSRIFVIVAVISLIFGIMLSPV